MKIIIEADTKSLSYRLEDTEEAVTFEDIMNALFGVFEDSAKRLLKSTKPDRDAQEALCFSLEDVFGHILYDKLFPQLKPGESDFDLCDAAIVRAQDEIIAEAERDGITFQEALAKYNEKAREYVNARKMS